MPLRISRTIPFRNYQRRVGKSTYYINAAVIGLECVAAGAEKPAALHIRWQPPKNRRDIANQAKSFILVAVLNLAFDAFDGYLGELARVSWLPVNDDTRQIIRKAFTKASGRAYSERERAEQLTTDLGLNVTELLLALDFTALWRNSLIHSSDPEDRLTEDAERKLLSVAPYFSERYAGLDLQQMVKRYRRNDPPTLKEATSLVAANQNLVRQVDAAILTVAGNSVASVGKIAKTILREKLLEGENSARLKALWSNDKETRARKVRTFLEQGGLTTRKEAISAELDPEFVDKFVALPRDEARNFLLK